MNSVMKQDEDGEATDDEEKRQFDKMMADMKKYNTLSIEEKNELIVKQ